MVPFALVAVFALLMLAPLIEAVSGSLRRERLACPVAGGSVTVELSERWAFGSARPVDVRSCSAFADPTAVTCDKACLSRFVATS